MRPVILLLVLNIAAVTAFAQPELEPWGNLTGIRVDGQLMPFETSLHFTGPNGLTQTTAKERQNPRYTRQGNTQFVYTHLDSLYFVEKVEELGRGEARITITCTAHADIHDQHVFFSVIRAKRQWLKIASPGHPVLRDTVEGTQLRTDIPIANGDLQKGDSSQLTFTITVNGTIDHQPVHLSLNTAKPGRPFDGLGGNFRIQNTKTDPQVIAYCLDHLRVTWGRVELPWRFWQPVKDSDPLDSALAGKLNPAVQRAVYMAGTLAERKIPLIVSAWFPPEWAVEGPLRMRPGPDHIWGNALNHANTDAIYKSIADYLVYLKQQFQVDVRYFSFNESDLGINVRQTALEHDELIKGLGAYFASRGLNTRVLLGDNSDATTWSFIGPAMNDPAARPYISMISFHSWRGFDTATLQKWADAATQLHVPVIVGEGSIDAAAWHYPAIFQEPAYALKEISLYTRLMAVCQPLSILQWQLTSDYSLLAGGGIFGDTSALHPTQRFWNLKQLAMTPPGLFAMPITASRPDIAVAAVGDNKKQSYAIHIVNNGATRQMILTGLPAGVELLRRYTTSQTKGAEEGASVHVSGGQATFRVESQSFVTLLDP
ncbi:MAG TPA: hypothetical protein VGS79_03150 [Puia sp.]|nr:hypothetical protein [Puia sp.]